MKGKKVTMSIRVNEELKSEAQIVFDCIGLDMSTAVNMFLVQCVRHGGLPFEAIGDIPNAETRAAIAEVEEALKHPETMKTYSSFQEMYEEALK